MDEIPSLPNKLLYLDADTVCYKDLSELYNIDISDYEVQNILGRDVSHCVINSYKRLYQGKLEILSGNSYSDLRYSNIGCGSID